MFEIKNKYIVDFWFNDKIKDCGKVIYSNKNTNYDETIETNHQNIPIFISQNESEHESIDEHLFETVNNDNDNDNDTDYDIDNENNNYNFDFKMKKLNNYYKINNTCRDNEYRKRKGRRNSKSNNSDISRGNTVCCHRIKSSGQIVSNNRMFDEKKSHQHNKLFNQSNSNNDKRKMYNLPKTSRLHEFKARERKVLLDS